MPCRALHCFFATAFLMSGVVGNLAAAEPPQSVRMVVTAAIVSESGLPAYEDLAKYLSRKLKNDTKVIGNLAYSEADLMLKRGVIQVGFVCGLPYTHAFKNGDYKLLAIPVMALKKGVYPDVPGYEKTPGKYFSYTIVRKDSPLKNWQDLHGHTYVYSDQNSNSGYNMPRYKLVQLGARSWEDWFSKITVSASHEESIRLVARGVVDASSVDSLVLDYDRSIGNADALNVKVIEAMHPGGAGTPPVVISSRAAPALAGKLQNLLFNMHNDPEGQRILKRALMLRFDPPKDSNYDDIRNMEEAARKAGFRDHIP